MTKKRLVGVPRRNFHVTVCGEHMVAAIADLFPATAIHNGVILSQFSPNYETAPDAPLVFLGRIERIKGVHHAITLSRQSGRKLLIAGVKSWNEESDRYFREQVEPHLGTTIHYIGPVNDAQKNELLRSAAAMLMPIEWDEPFGIVMAESLACGTPVIGFGRGALPEIVDHGKTGAICSTIDEMAQAVRNIHSFSRRECRKVAEDRFASESIVTRYTEFYDRIDPSLAG